MRTRQEVRHMLATRWNPWQDLLEVERQLGALTRSFSGTQRTRNGATAMIPALDTFTRGDDLVVRAELPGVDPDKDIEVSLQDNVLTLRGERRREDRAEEGDYFRFESSYGSFQRDIPLPEGVKADEIKASYDRGILEIVVPNAVSASTRKKIEISSGDERRELNTASTNGG
jgi:HSP20 family protein